VFCFVPVWVAELNAKKSFRLMTPCTGKTVVDIVNVRVPSVLDWLRAAGIHVSQGAQNQTCRAALPFTVQ